MNEEQIKCVKFLFSIFPGEFADVTRLKTSRLWEFVEPAKLQDVLDLSLTTEGDGLEALILLIGVCVRYSTKTYHPNFYNQLYSRPLITSMVGAMFTKRFNASMALQATPKSSLRTVYNAMESMIYGHMMRHCLGWEEPGVVINCPGGSLGNVYGVYVALLRKVEDYGRSGVKRELPLCFYTSALSHYSLKKAALFLGLGMDAVISVPCDHQGCMRPDVLEEYVKRDAASGLQPFLVVATSGTTVFGAYDPIDQIAAVCARHKLWLHVDGCLGGSALVSNRLRNLMRGVHLADSVVWNPHKMMGATLQHTIFFCRRSSLNDTVLKEAFCCGEACLDPPSFSESTSEDNLTAEQPHSVFGDRIVDILPLWLNWLHLGTTGYAQYIEKKFALTKYLVQRMEERTGEFQLLVQPQCINVCFYYIPKSMRGMTRDEAWWQRLNRLPAIVKGMMAHDGHVLVAYQMQEGQHVTFYRMVCNQGDNTEEDMDLMLENIARLSETVLVSLRDKDSVADTVRRISLTFV